MRNSWGKTYFAEIEAMVAGSGFTEAEKTLKTAEEVFLNDYVKGTKISDDGQYCFSNEIY